MEETKKLERDKINRGIAESQREGTEENSMIVDEENQVISVVDLINSSSSPNIAVRVKTLLENGITEEMFESKFQELSGGITDINVAMENLKKICERLAQYISGNRNGIIIDEDTGEVDELGSLRDKVETGILTENDVIIIDPIAEKYEIVETKNIIDYLLDSKLLNTAEKDEILYNASEFKFEDIFSNIFTLMNGQEISEEEKKKVVEEIDKFFGSKEDFPQVINEFIEKIESYLEKTPYEQDPYLYEISSLELKYRKTTDAQQRAVLDLKIKEFYKNHSEYTPDKIPVLSINPNIAKEAETEFYRFAEKYMLIETARKVEKFKKLTPEEVQGLSDKDKSEFMLVALYANKFTTNVAKEAKTEDKDIKVYLGQEGINIIKTLYPEWDLERTAKADSKRIASQVFKLLGRDVEPGEASLFRLTQYAVEKLGAQVDIYLSNDHEPFKRDLSNEIELKANEYDYEKSLMQKYFEDSKLNFTPQTNFNKDENDEKRFNHIYHTSNVKAWIDEKDTALVYRYLSLKNKKSSYKYIQNTEEKAKKIEEIDAEIAEFESKYGKIDITPEQKEDFGHYKAETIKANLVKYYARDMAKFQENGGYQNLSNEEKAIYIMRTISGIGESDPTINLMAHRRLELMGDEAKSFIKFDKYGKIWVKQKSLLEEFNSVSGVEIDSYLKLVRYIEKNEDAEVDRKLEEYSNLREEDFVKLEDRRKIEKSFAQIDKARQDAARRRRETEEERLAREEYEQKSRAEAEVKARKESEKLAKEEKTLVENENGQLLSGKDISKGIKDGILKVEILRDSAIHAKDAEAKNAEPEITEETAKELSEEIESPSTEISGTSDTTDTSAIMTEETEELEEELVNPKKANMFSNAFKFATSYLKKIKDRFNNRKNPRLGEGKDIQDDKKTATLVVEEMEVEKPKNINERNNFIEFVPTPTVNVVKKENGEQEPISVEQDDRDV